MSTVNVFGRAPRPNLNTGSQTAGESANGSGSVAATLDLSTVGTNIDTVIRATTAGLDGNSITLEFADGSAVDAGELTVVSNVVTFTFKTGVTTAADFEAAVAALTGDDAIIEVATPNTLLGELVTTDDEWAAEALTGGEDIIARTIPIDPEHGHWALHLIVAGTPTGSVQFAYSNLPYPDVDDDTHWVTDATKSITLSGSASSSYTNNANKVGGHVRCKVTITAGADVTVCGWAVDVNR